MEEEAENNTQKVDDGGENSNENFNNNGSNSKIMSSNEGQSKPKRQMKTPFQLEMLEKAYALETYPSEATRVELSEKLGLSDRQLQMLKDKDEPCDVKVLPMTQSDSLIPYTSVIGGILACKLIYDLTHLIGTNYFKTYSSFSKIQRIEWNNRSVLTIHSIFITAMSLYLVFCSNLFSDNQSTDPITVRNSSLSTFALGVSVGYFIFNLAMILWFFPSLGGHEYVVHHMFSLVAAAYSMLKVWKMKSLKVT